MTAAPQHCDHECVCYLFMQDARLSTETICLQTCKYDTRSPPATPAPESLFSETTLDRVKREAAARALEEVLERIKYQRFVDVPGYLGPKSNQLIAMNQLGYLIFLLTKNPDGIKLNDKEKKSLQHEARP